MRKTRERNVFRKILTVLLSATIVLNCAVTCFAENIKKPSINAGGAIVYCENTGEIVYSKNIDKQYCPYSITKILTCLLAVQKLTLDKEVIVSAKAASQGDSTMNLKVGEKVTIENLLYGAMLPSGNDAAYALAEAVSGNMDSFLKLMNKTAENIGCKNTHFTSASGLDNKNNLSTAYDMMQITKVAFSNEILMKIAGSKTYKMAKTNKSKERTLKTHVEKLLDSKTGVYAAKTGYWDEYNTTIALAFKENGLNLYVVLLGDTKDEREKDIDKLIDYTTKKVQGAKVIKQNEAAGKVRIKHGAKTRLQTYTQGVGYAYLPKEGSDSLISTKVVMKDDITAPVKAGTVVGNYQIYVADEMVNEVPLIIKEDVAKGWLPSYIGISNLMTIIVLIVLLIIVILVLVILILRAKNKRKYKKIRERKLMEMARREAEIQREHDERDWKF